MITPEEFRNKWVGSDQTKLVSYSEEELQHTLLDIEPTSDDVCMLFQELEVIDHKCIKANSFWWFELAQFER
ncbi:hypothetical protein GXP67_34230 [Rhodocytophaga rosea]|uniref:Uncharacterized protein n=1 Tax=Rhodocytophaga rosea TaxID=2704465 RepID=A0A6C0GT62_9BACT|nr:hypothetical protein [Rhodocytophaga rosea]QHT71358.1 hypothetical protein GXP67_34230 [Rhodocytophaga rosea]